jgi:hypothetical protein
MEYYEDSINARRNTVTIINPNCGPAYNSVLSTSFSAESTTEPVTLQEAKDWCRIDVNDDDTLITSLITAARIMCENYANLSFINRTVTAKIKNRLGGFNPPYGPLKEITSATDSDGNAITDFDFDNAYPGNVTIVYTAGYDTLPVNLKTAILNQIAFLYENRGDIRLQHGMSEEAKLILNQVRIV